jgi:hypothetical protein
MVTKTLYISGTTGTMLIADSSVPITTQLLNSPSDLNRDSLYFHSKGNYGQIRAKIAPTQAVVFPALARFIETWSDGSKGCTGGC